MAGPFRVEDVFVAPDKGLVIVCLADADDRRRLVTGMTLVFKNRQEVVVQRTILDQETLYSCFGDPEHEPKNHLILVSEEDAEAISRGATFQVIDASTANMA